MVVNIDLGDIEKNISQTIADVDGKIRRTAGKSAGFKLGEKLEGNTPTDPTTGRVLLKETVSVSAVRENGEVDVGYGRKAYFRAHVVNMGSQHQAGQHFIEKTVDTEAEAVMQEYMTELKKGLGL
ncbi:HK97-gp10 family putative phage morphogenesis protein [Marinilactibacillus sp. XAAS-LB27]|uniref:HK97-gp10 family putative phage morphogenesis protein n=1 Tax=Marinilactibacillus sp. XAAS-LB27 TaxID=3114538 RepID=UPI002E187733|nr:HK97-gp10 family putative phage morphogenesis protein [Marinilactibacillus sp. XAAS-LB27]